MVRVLIYIRGNQTDLSTRYQYPETFFKDTARAIKKQLVTLDFSKVAVRPTVICFVPVRRASNNEANTVILNEAHIAAVAVYCQKRIRSRVMVSVQFLTLVSDNFYVSRILIDTNCSSADWDDSPSSRPRSRKWIKDRFTVKTEHLRKTEWYFLRKYRRMIVPTCICNSPHRLSVFSPFFLRQPTPFLNLLINTCCQCASPTLRHHNHSCSRLSRLCCAR